MDAVNVRGSFAGAIGIPQFMPGSQRRYAVDFDGDQKIDLSGSIDDAIGSVGRFLEQHGWETGQPIAVPARTRGEPERSLIEAASSRRCSSPIWRSRASPEVPTRRPWRRSVRG